MATLADQLTYDLLDVIADAPEDLTIGADTFEGTRGGLVRSQVNMEGGLLAEPVIVWSTTLKMLDQQGRLVDRFPNFSTPYALAESVDGERVVLDGQTLLIDKVTVDEFEVAIQLDLVSPNKEGR